MAYTKTTWAANDVITAAKLNKAEQGIYDAQNGWEVSLTQLFSESVTTIADEYGTATGTLAHLLTAPTLIINFNGTDYTRVEDRGNYGAPWSNDLGNYDFSVYPFSVFDYDGNVSALVTPNAGTYTISASVETTTTTSDFDKAVQKAVGGGIFPITLGTTTFQEVFDAMLAGKICIVVRGDAMNGYVNTYYATSAVANNYSVKCVCFDTLDNKINKITFTASSANDPLYE